MQTEEGSIWNSQTQTTNELSAKTPRKNKLRKKLVDKSKTLRSKGKQSNRDLFSTKVRYLKEFIDYHWFLTLVLTTLIVKHMYFQHIDKYGNKNEFKELCSRILPPFFAHLTRNVVDAKNRNSKGRRYTKELKQHALSLYYTSPRTYRRMLKIYYFPSVKTLRRMTENLQQSAGLNNFVFRSLQMRMQFKEPKDKQCVLMMDEISLKTNLQYDIKKDEIIGFHDLGKLLCV